MESEVLNIMLFPKAMFGIPDLNGSQNGKLKGIIKNTDPVA